MSTEINALAHHLSFIEQLSPYCYKINTGFVPNMRVPGYVYVNETLKTLLFDELDQFITAKGVGGFLPALNQIGNVATLPGIVNRSIALPDVHSGYGFAIGNVAAMDMNDPTSVVSPGGVGFDINCGVRMIRTNLHERDLRDIQETLAQVSLSNFHICLLLLLNGVDSTMDATETLKELFETIPVGVGSKGLVNLKGKDLDQILNRGIDWAVENDYAWAEDKLKCEEWGCMTNASSKEVSKRAKSRGISQLGTLGAGNHYIEVQVVDEIVDPWAAKHMGIDQVGQVCVMIHSGSRGLGHQVATDSLVKMEADSANMLQLNDRQLACTTIQSELGQSYLAGMAASANYAWVNRQVMTHLTRKAFAKCFNSTPDDLDMHLVYDVCHNIAKIEDHQVADDTYYGSTSLDSLLWTLTIYLDASNYRPRKLLVHRKGSTRAFGPHHPMIPIEYKACGQPVLVGGTMGTESWVLTGTEQGMLETFGSTCHGAGRAVSRAKCKKTMPWESVLADLRAKNISVRCANPKSIAEEAPDAYKNVRDVVETCHAANLSKKCIRLRPVVVIKG